MKFRKQLYEKSSDLFARSIGLILFIALWELAPKLGLVRAAYLSPPSAVLQALYRMGLRGDLSKHFLVSLQRALVGLGVSSVVGVVLGLFIGYFRRIERYLNLLFQSFRQMSAFALFPVFILFFGLGELSKTIIIFWASLWPVLLNTCGGVKNVDKILVRSAVSMGASKLFIFLKIILPAAAPEIFTGIRLGGSYCVMAVVAAEMIGATSGLGYLVIYSEQTFNTPEMYGGIVMLAVLGLGLNYVLHLIERFFTSWKEDIRAGE
ncbi:ABC transporter permease [Spirochaetia bacterium]|nr:ABC transporter permease [Spirochaetia bacterium]